jgi:predicted TIM-barrel fold metal-dependent hydrolase
MKVIAFEEHYGLPAIYEAAIKANDPYALVLEALKKAGHFPVPADPKVGFPAGIYDLSDGRLAAMDDAGIDVQILSYATPSAERLEPSLAKELTSQANDTLAAAVSKHPDRFLGFATLPLLDPAAAARELERAVRDLGFVGAMINGNINGRFLDDKSSGQCLKAPKRSASQSTCMSIFHPSRWSTPTIAASHLRYPLFCQLRGAVGTSKTGYTASA